MFMRTTITLVCIHLVKCIPQKEKVTLNQVESSIDGQDYSELIDVPIMMWQTWLRKQDHFSLQHQNGKKSPTLKGKLRKPRVLERFFFARDWMARFWKVQDSPVAEDSYTCQSAENLGIDQNKSWTMYNEMNILFSS